MIIKATGTNINIYIILHENENKNINLINMVNPSGTRYSKHAESTKNLSSGFHGNCTVNTKS